MRCPGHIILARRRRRNPNVEHHDLTLGGWFAIEYAEAVLVVVSGVLPQIPFVPILAVLVLDVEALVRQVGVLWDVDLDVTASFKLKRLTVLNLEHELLDEGGDVVVRAHFAPELFDPEDLLRDADLHVFFDLDLARKPPVLFGFFAVDMTRLRREQITAPSKI